MTNVPLSFQDLQHGKGRNHCDWLLDTHTDTHTYTHIESPWVMYHCYALHRVWNECLMPDRLFPGGVLINLPIKLTILPSSLSGTLSDKDFISFDNESPLTTGTNQNSDILVRIIRKINRHSLSFWPFQLIVTHQGKCTMTSLGRGGHTAGSLISPLGRRCLFYNHGYGRKRTTWVKGIL